MMLVVVVVMGDVVMTMTMVGGVDGDDIGCHDCGHAKQRWILQCCSYKQDVLRSFSQGREAVALCRRAD